MHKRAHFSFLSAIIVSAALFIGGQSFAQAVKPLDDGREHLGVASCGGTTCHSRQAATGPSVRQNEMVTWQDATSITGAHSRAYSVLLSGASKQIAKNLGIGPAEQAGECLMCHAHNVAEEQRGPGFTFNEGVTCEACHGGSGDWLNNHYAATATHADNVRNGLYPTDNVEARASLCLDCHYGSDREDQFVTHRIMGAGHPRISFELDLFSALQQHHDVDADYLERKTDAGGFRTWMVGQSMSIARSARLFANDEIGVDGLFPELYFFDCHACHQTISNAPDAVASWRPNPARPLGPGVPVYNDANAIVLRAAIDELLPNESGELRRLSARLHAATTADRAATKRAANELANYADRLRGQFLTTSVSREQAVSIMNRIMDGALSRQYTNYAAGEQAVIAVDTFLNAMVAENMIDRSVKDALTPALDRAFDAVESPNRYNQSSLRSALSQIATATRRL